MSVSLVVDATHGPQRLWERALKEYVTWRVSGEQPTITVFGSARLERSLSELPVLWRRTRVLQLASTRKNFAVKESDAELLIFIQNPVVLRGEIETCITPFMEDELLAALQTRLVRDKSSIGFPLRGGFKRLFGVPYLDGTFAVVRRSKLVSIGGFSSMPRLASWIDVSLRLMGDDGLLATTESVTSVQLKNLRRYDSIFNELYRGCVVGWILAYWLPFISLRARRIINKEKDALRWRARACKTLIFERRILPVVKHCISSMLFYTIIAGTFPLVLGWVGILYLMGSRPWGRELKGNFMWKDDYGIYSTRMGRFNPFALLPEQYRIVKAIKIDRDDPRLSHVKLEELPPRLKSELLQFDVIDTD